MQIDTFLHVQTPNGRSLGFSALMSQITDSTNRYNQKGDLMCWLSTTKCNPKDKHFNKKLARQSLWNKAQERVRVRDLPTILACKESECWGGHEERLFQSIPNTNKYNFVLKRFV